MAACFRLEVALVLAAEDIDLDAEPEEGDAGEMAPLHDALMDARKKEEKAEKEAEAASDLAEEKLEQIKQTGLTETDEQEIETLKKEAIEAKRKAVQAAREAAKADDAEQSALKAGVRLTEKDKDTS